MILDYINISIFFMTYDGNSQYKNIIIFNGKIHYKKFAI